MGTITILPETTKNPITLMGQRAGVCWGADTSDDAKNYQRGLDCIQSGHGRVMEYVNVEMVLNDFSARVIREWYTHIGGAPTRLRKFLLSTTFVAIPKGSTIATSSLGMSTSSSSLYPSIMFAIVRLYISNASKLLHILNGTI